MKNYRGQSTINCNNKFVIVEEESGEVREASPTRIPGKWSVYPKIGVVYRLQLPQESKDAFVGGKPYNTTANGGSAPAIVRGGETVRFRLVQSGNAHMFAQWKLEWV